MCSKNCESITQTSQRILCKIAIRQTPSTAAVVKKKKKTLTELMKSLFNVIKSSLLCYSAVTASHPQVVTIFIAAESFTDMNK